MDAQFAVVILFILLLAAGLLALLAILLVERQRLKRWVDKVRDGSRKDD